MTQMVWMKDLTSPRRVVFADNYLPLLGIFISDLHENIHYMLA